MRWTRGDPSAAPLTSRPAIFVGLMGLLAACQGEGCGCGCGARTSTSRGARGEALAAATSGRVDGARLGGRSPLRPTGAGRVDIEGAGASGNAPRASGEGVKVGGAARGGSADGLDGGVAITGNRGAGGAGGQAPGAGGAGGEGGLGDAPEEWPALPLAALGGVGPSADQACSDSANTRCQRLSECSNGALITQRYGDLATCVLRGKLGCMQSQRAPGTGATPTTVAACAAAIPAERCGAFLDGAVVQACRPQSGARALGAGCAFSAQCMTAFCLVPRGQACGACAVEPAHGAACASTSDCGHAQTRVSPFTSQCSGRAPRSTS